jgi:CRISPR-associated protein Csm2
MANPTYQKRARHEGGPRRDDRRGGRPSGDGPRGPYVPDVDLTGIRLAGKLDPELFNGVARRAAETIGGPERYQKNKPSQIRRFYDELTMWVAKVEQNPERFEEYLPFIRMLNAKAAYAEGRELVDRNFVRLLAHCLKAVEDAATLRTAKLFFEAFLGFYKEVRPKDNQ